jgi:hypothetical protein
VPALVPVLLLVLALTLAVLAAPATAAPEQGNFTLGGVKCNLIPAAPTAAPPVGISPCPGVRPGAPVQTATGMCTLNFLFQGSDGHRYIGTAGHCVLLDAATGTLPGGAESGEAVYEPGSAPEARDGAGARIGEFAYAILSDPKDFSLIRLDPGVEASPQMCHFGGPTGINDETPTGPVILHMYGNGVVIGTVAPARTLVAAGMPDPDHLFAQGVVLPGDSGAGVISDDGRAVGVAVTVGVHGPGSIGLGSVDAGTVGITRITPQVERAEEMLGIDLALVTAPTL